MKKKQEIAAPWKQWLDTATRGLKNHPDWGLARQELLDLAISWAGWPAEEARFKAFVQGYRDAGGVCDADAALLYDSRRNHIDWLEYNARRALFDDPEERRIGREQIVETIGKIGSDQQARKTILQWLEELNINP